MAVKMGLVHMQGHHVLALKTTLILINGVQLEEKVQIQRVGFSVVNLPFLTICD